MASSLSAVTALEEAKKTVEGYEQDLKAFGAEVDELKNKRLNEQDTSKHAVLDEAWRYARTRLDRAEERLDRAEERLEALLDKEREFHLALRFPTSSGRLPTAPGNHITFTEIKRFVQQSSMFDPLDAAITTVHEDLLKRKLGPYYLRDTGIPIVNGRVNLLFAEVGVAHEQIVKACRNKNSVCCLALSGSGKTTAIMQASRELYITWFECGTDVAGRPCPDRNFVAMVTHLYDLQKENKEEVLQARVRLELVARLFLLWHFVQPGKPDDGYEPLRYMLQQWSKAGQNAITLLVHHLRPYSMSPRAWEVVVTDLLKEIEAAMEHRGQVYPLAVAVDEASAGFESFAPYFECKSSLHKRGVAQPLVAFCGVAELPVVTAGTSRSLQTEHHIASALGKGAVDSR